MKIFLICSLIFIVFLSIPLGAGDTPPPTKAITFINGTGGNVSSFAWNGFIELIEGAGIAYDFDYDNSELTISSGAGSAALEQLTNVTDDFCNTNQVRKAIGNQWTCADDNVGAGTLDELSDVVLSLVNYGDILLHNGVSWINRHFMINTQMAQTDFQIIGIDNQTGIITRNQFSINSIITDCTNDDKVSSISINNATGTILIGCSADISGADILDDLTDVTISTPAYRHILQYDNGQWINKLFTINTQSAAVDFQVIGLDNQTGVITRNQFSINNISTTCSGTDKVDAITINNVTGQVTVTCDTVTAGISDIIQEGNSNVEVIDAGIGEVQIDIDGINEFRFITNLLDAFGATLDNVAVLISNAADPADAGVLQLGNTEIIAWESSPASTDLTITSDAGENFVWNSGWNNIDLGSNAMINSIFDVAGTGNRLTSTSTALGDILKSDGTDFKRLARGSAGQVLKVNAGGTDIAWDTDATGAGGSGIPLPPKKWGELIPKTASTDTIGLVAGCTILATASYVYDVTDNSGAILSTTAVTDGTNGGIHCTGTNNNVFRGDQNAYMYSKWEADKITTNRIFIGFHSTTTLLPNNADTILDNLIGVGLCIRTTDTIYQFCRNDGDATTDYSSLTTTENTGVHFFEVYTTDAGTTWCGKLDGGTPVCHTTEIPTATTRLYPMSTGETDGGATAILWTQYLWYLQNDK